MEGWFLFRYRVFDLFSVSNGSQPILAECWGSPFRIYATKQFPGLEPSTELTKVINLAATVISHCSLLSSCCIAITCQYARGKSAGSARRTLTTTPAPTLKISPLLLEPEKTPHPAIAWLHHSILNSVFICTRFCRSWLLMIHLPSSHVNNTQTQWTIRVRLITHPPIHRFLSRSRSRLFRFFFPNRAI